MARTVVWTETAANDLDAIADFIAQDSASYSAAFVREVRDAGRSLRHMAERGRIVPEWKDASIRELLVGNHRLIYQLAGQTVSIVGLIHGARDLRALWEREERGPSG